MVCDYAVNTHMNVSEIYKTLKCIRFHEVKVEFLCIVIDVSWCILFLRQTCTI